MLKQALILSSLVVLLGSCSALKPLGFNNNNQKQESSSPPATGKKEVKFLDNIDMNVEQGRAVQDAQKPEKSNSPQKTEPVLTNIPASNIEKTTSLQVKYAVLLNTEVENVREIAMFEFIDDWYGTRYRLGGTTKKGIDCSAFTQLFFSTVYGISLPRTAREQYKGTKLISQTHLQQGDLVFFNTSGGVSHVGIYLQNKKFVHASASGGVTISDFYDPYWRRKFIGAGRMNLSRTVKENSRSISEPAAGSN